MFVLASCDTVSYFYRNSMEAILERVLKQEVLAVELLSDYGRAYPSLGDVRRKAGKICLDICLWYVCSNVCSNILPLTVRKYAVTGIHNAYMKIENSCQIPEKGRNEVVDAGSF